MKVVGGGQVARFDKNKAAIELRNRLVDEGRKPTREEQEVLAGYTGWGSFGQELFQGNWAKPAPKAGWEARDAWLRENLGQAEWEGMQNSIINAHYTDPPTVLAMWDMVRRLGFTGGRTLEPSIGIGNFYGMMPADMAARSQRAGIELDSVTGSMAQMLYPNANIQIKGYQDSQTPDNFYDLVIGNWPFFEQGPADRRYNRLNPTLHDYFFLKALDQTKPGGLVVGITTKGTMDKMKPGARMEMARKGELVAAFRLPTGAFEEYAGTKVVTDIIILRKREQPLGLVDKEGWIEVRDHDTPEGTKVPVNEYFHRNPHHVIGKIDFGHGTTTFRPGLIVHRPDDMMAQLKRIVELVPKSEFTANKATKSISYVANHTSDRTNSLVKTPQGFFVVAGEYMAPANEVAKYQLKDANKTAVREAELGKLIDMRRLYGELIDAERAGKADAPRKAMREAYEAFVKEHGKLNQSFGLSYLEKIDDPFYPALAALEVVSVGADGKPSYRPAAILTESTIRGRRTVKNPSIADAFVLARSESVSPTIEQIAEKANKPVDEVRASLVASGAGFVMPNGDFAPADVYLSGNVRAKLRDARAALEDGNAAMKHNVDELTKVLPADIPYYKIETQMGATWVPAKAYADYIAHMLGMSSAGGIDVAFEGGAWKVDFPPGLNNRPEARSGFGTTHVKFKRLVRAAIANQSITVKYKDSDGTERVDDEGTKEVNAKIADMRVRFGEWLWKDPVRRGELEREYNEVRNSYTTPKFDGSFLGFEGMALSLGRGPFQLREHQVNAIWRALVTRKSLNAHEVGTGKTFTMGGIAVESRRYGIAKKPLLFAHNANSKSVASEIQMMYPAAKVLYVDNLSKENVKTRMMQIANDDWDVVVLPHSLIDRIGFKEETLNSMAAEQIRDLEIAAEEAAKEDNVSISNAMWEDEKELAKLRSATAKQLVKQRLKIKETIRKLAQQAAREDSVSFEDLGIDMVLVDEAHEFKKPPIATKMKMKGLQTQTSNRSIAMSFITGYVRTMNNGANVHLFTGTPITNTMTEVFHMMRYMMQEEMSAAALADWDGWFGSFAREVNDVELNPAGEYEAVTRLQAFINVPELRRMIGQYMDVVFADDMPEMQPRRVNGKLMSDKTLTEAERAELLNGRTENATDRPYKKVINENSDMTPDQLRVFAQVQGWARAWRNMGKKARKEAMTLGTPESPIIHEGIAAKASFDPRLVDSIENAGKEGTEEMAPHPQSKPARVLANLLEIYRGDDRATQVVFMEQGMARTVSRREGPPGMKRDVTYKSFSTMHDMIERLVQAGVPREQIAAVDGSTSKDKRKEVADGMNTGRIRIVFGSTDSLGVGVNMQKNLRAMHHMDAPWMPGELEQRNGRGHRQGNQWNTVREYRYLTDRLDGRRWQVLAIKQRFITDFMKSKGEARVIEGDAASDDGGDILSTFSEAAGDPRVLLREKWKGKVAQLQSRERLHGQAIEDAEREVDSAARLIYSLKQQLEKIQSSGIVDKLAAISDAQRGDGFTMRINSDTFTKRDEATEALKKFGDDMRIGDDRQIGTYGPAILYAEWDKLEANPSIYIKVGDEKIRGRGMSMLSLDGNIRSLRDTVESTLAERIEAAEKRMAHARKVAKEPFHLGDQLAKARQTLDDLIADLAKNPVAPPYWLRTGAPADTEVYRNGKRYVVSGHRWTADGWFVVAGDERGDVAIDYLDATDVHGIPLYEPREFTPPVVNTKDGKPVAAAAPDASTNQGDARLSLSGSRGGSRTSAAVQREVDQITAGWSNSPQVVVLDSMADPRVPAAARAAAADRRNSGAAGSPEGFFLDGKVYLLSSRLKTPADTARVLLHEALGHAGLRGVFGPGLNDVLDRFADSMPAKVAAKAKEYGLDMKDTEQRRQAAEEALAELAQTRPTLGSVQRLIAAVRAWLREHIPGFGSMKMSDAEVVQQFIAPARGWVERGQGQAAGPARFSVSLEAAEDLPAQEQWLQRQAKEAGFRDIDDMLERDYPAFEALAKQWRAEHPADVMFSLSSSLAGAMNNARDVKLGAGYVLGDLMNNGTGKLGWWHKSVGTMHNLAQRNPLFKRVYDSAQNFINDVSWYATEAANEAPSILPKLETWRDLGKKPLSAEDTKAMSRAVFEGTVGWVRDAAGKPVKAEDAERAAAGMTSDEKAHELMRAGKLAPEVLRMWQGRSIDQFDAMVGAAYEREMLTPGVVWTDGEMRSLFGMSAGQIKLYREARAAIDKSLTNLAISDMVRFAGKDADDVREQALAAKTVEQAAVILRDRLFDLASNNESRADVLNDTGNRVMEKAGKIARLIEHGYAPLMRFGELTLDVVGKGGERLFFSLYESRIDRAMAKRKLAEQFPGATITEGTTSQEQSKLFQGITPETLELFGEMIGLEAQGDGTSSQLFQQYLKVAKDNRSALKRLIHRKGTAGFSQDAARVLAGFVYSNARLNSRNLHQGEMTAAASAIPKSQGELLDAAVRLTQYVSNPAEEATAIKGLIFANFLGGSIASAMVNATQPFTVAMPYLSQWGGITKAGKRMARATEDALKRKTGDAALDKALAEAEEKGIVSPQEVHQLIGQAAGKGALVSGDGTQMGDAIAASRNALSRVVMGWGKVFSIPEQFNRRVTFIAAYRTAVQEGMADPAAFAEQAVNDTMFVYSKANRPRWARGFVGSLAFTFKTFSISYVELLHRMATQGGPEGKRAALYSLGVLFLMAGMQGLPGSDDLDDIIDGALQRLGYNWSTKQRRRELLAGFLGDGAANFMLHGISGVPGAPIDVSGRMGLGNLVPGTGLFTKKADYTRDITEVAGPVATLASNYFNAAGAAIQGDVGTAAFTALPVAAQNMAKALDMWSTGMYRDQKGRKVIDVDGFDAAVKMLGFQPGDVSKVQDASRMVQQGISLNKLREAEIADRWALGRFENDPDKIKDAREELAQWNLDNPSSPINISSAQIIRRVREMNKPKSERLAATAPKEIRAAVRRDLEGR